MYMVKLQINASYTSHNQSHDRAIVLWYNGEDTRGQFFLMDVKGEEPAVRGINCFGEETAYHLIDSILSHF